jgi:hypothetical protein
MWCYIAAVFFCLIGFNYFSLFWAKKKPKIWLTSIHIVLQIVSLIPFIIAIFSVQTDGTFSTNGFFAFMPVDQAFMLSFLIFLFSVFIHLINFFTSLFLKTK